MRFKKISRKGKEFLRYESILEVTSWWSLLVVSWIIKLFYSPGAKGLPYLYLIILSLTMSGLLFLRLFPNQVPQERKVFVWCLLYTISVLVFEHFTGGAESPFWFLYLIPLIVSTLVFRNPLVPFVFLLFICIFIILDASWVNEFSPSVIKSCITKIMGLGMVGLFSHFLNKETLRIKNELTHAYESLREKQDEIERINTELKIQRENLLETTKELQRANEYLRRLSKIKSDFVSVVSHELRTPLTSIRESISLILDGEAGEINTEQLKFLRIAEKNIERLSNLISDILDFSKLESGTVSVNPRKVDINSVIANVYETLYPAIQEKMLTVKMEFDRDLPEIWIDPEKISQVITNILGNAIKFSPVGGNIWIMSRSLILDGKEQIDVSIRDSGPGIPSENIPKLFIPFSQLESPLTRKSGGTGLGLAISKNIVELHGGSIGVSSELGKGSEFYFRIPIYRKDIELNFILDEEISKYKTHHLSFSLILIRLKNFEKLKQTLLDKEWEELNGEIIERVKKTVRGPRDRISHYKEGEFLAIIAETNREGALKIIKRIKDAVEKDEVINKVASVSLDFGIAVYPEEADKKDSLIAKAEEELSEKDLVKKED